MKSHQCGARSGLPQPSTGLPTYQIQKPCDWESQIDTTNRLQATPTVGRS